MIHSSFIRQKKTKNFFLGVSVFLLAEHPLFFLYTTIFFVFFVFPPLHVYFFLLLHPFLDRGIQNFMFFFSPSEMRACREQPRCTFIFNFFFFLFFFSNFLPLLKDGNIFDPSSYAINLLIAYDEILSSFT